MNPRLVIIAGPNGSGKTSITDLLKEIRHIWMAGCEYINPDNIAEQQFGGWNNNAAMLQAAEEATRLRYDFLDRKIDFAFETVFSSDEKITFLRQAKEMGYFIRIFFVSTDSPLINVNRVGSRFEAGGHAVPIDKIISRYYKSLANIAEAATFADHVYFYDNTAEYEDGIRLEWTPLFRTKNGKVATKYRDPVEHPWASAIYQNLIAEA